jgi:4-hydroxy-tetrahydrodipicolinate synthase
MNFIPKGIIPPLITPVTEEGMVNETVLRQLVDHLIDEGVDGLFPLGTSGEFYAFNDEEYKTILKIVIEQANHRVPVYAGTSEITTRGTLRLVKYAESIGADAISVLTPMFVGISQQELYDFYKTVAENTALPIVMYNNKPKTGTTITPETVVRLAEVDNIVAVKDSTGDMTNTGEYIRLTQNNENFHVLVGRDTLIYAALSYGASGSIASCANVAPQIACDIYDKFVAGDLQGALEAQFKLDPLRIACGWSTFPAVIKAGLELEGYKVGNCVAPIGPLASDKKEELRKLLKNMNLI